MSPDPGALTAPERNRYFYGMLMDVERFDKDQHYFNRKRHLLNRLAAGSGVVCGLGLTFDTGALTLTLAPGVAIDRAGREIVVPAATPVDIAHLTDANGKPTGPVPAGSTILISLAYRERKIDPIAVLVLDCDNPGGCAPSTIEETFAIVVTVAGPIPALPGCVVGTFPLPPGTALQTAVAGVVSAAFTGAPADATIALGRLTLPAGPLDVVSDRPVVYNNALLYGLISCLAERVAAVSGDALVYVSGDNQSAAANTTLPNSLIVALQDPGGNPVTGGSAPVFTVTAGGGSVGPVQTLAGGQYQATWTLGPAGPQTVTAKSADSGLTVTFHATAS
jgi:hypothetical protein